MDYSIEVFQSMSVGLACWFFVWGMNRIYLWVKRMVS